MAEYSTLVNLLHTVSDDPIDKAIKSVLDAISSEHSIISDHIERATLRHWAKAIHTSRLDTMSHSELVEALGYVDKFNQQEIELESLNYFLGVTVHIDTDSVKNKFNLNGQDVSINLNSFIGEDPNSLKEKESLDSSKKLESASSEQLPPNKSIDWTFISKNKVDTIQLKSFYMSSMHIEPELKTDIEGKESDDKNRYKSHEVNETPNGKKSYWFDFTINNGTQLFKFDPFIDEGEHKQ